LDKDNVILIDKPYEWTSFDVVKKIKYPLLKHLNLKKLKIGHAGTLDPLATGLLIICTGKKTKEINHFQDLYKVYEATIKLGATTPSFDLETPVNQTFDIDHIDEQQINEAAKSFIGLQEQEAPMFSAKWHQGKRAYEYAREGKTVVLKKNKIEIMSFDILEVKLPEIKVRIKCTKGTYIRSIARDFGLKLKSGAHLIELRRTEIGNFNVKDAYFIDEFINLIKS
jgi:tRNA pseudouridine55 synthase